MNKSQQPPAITTIRGFQTPTASGDEDSDYGCNTPARYVHKINDVPLVETIYLSWHGRHQQIEVTARYSEHRQ
ncbi:serine threonine- kinase psk1 protein [Rutstroemia sp. NJR-2017a BBW]|nr:serine threonine- kinase psk1 protein [Rutstroemia sp. NJR-2017a BBW]